MTITLTRLHDNGIETVGHVEAVNDAGEKLTFQALELPWKDNHHDISCIPCRIYTVKKVGPSANIPYDHLAIQDVPERSGVCIHAANYVSQLRGCVAVGMSLTDINGDGQLDTTSSKVALKKLMDFLPEESELIIVKNF